MPPKPSTSTAGTAARGRPPAPKAKPSTATSKAPTSKATAASKGKQRAAAASPEPSDDDDMNVEDEQEDEPNVIPPDLLTHILHEFFEKGRDGAADGEARTRITKDANEAVAKYMDIFVKEAVARAAAERGSGFLEVEDLEKIAPQLLLDL